MKEKTPNERAPRLVITKPAQLGRTVAAAALEDWKRNFAATTAEELRTEGHARTRRPLTSPHE